MAEDNWQGKQISVNAGGYKAFNIFLNLIMSHLLFEGLNKAHVFLDFSAGMNFLSEGECLPLST